MRLPWLWQAVAGSWASLGCALNQDTEVELRTVLIDPYNKAKLVTDIVVPLAAAVVTLFLSLTALQFVVNQTFPASSYVISVQQACPGNFVPSREAVA